jgi:hypothetical protein
VKKTRRRQQRPLFSSSKSAPSFSSGARWRPPAGWRQGPREAERVDSTSGNWRWAWSMGSCPTSWRPWQTPRLSEEAPTNGIDRRIQVSLNNVARTITQTPKTAHVRVTTLLANAKIPSNNNMVVRAMATKVWNARNSVDDQAGRTTQRGTSFFPHLPKKPTGKTGKSKSGRTHQGASQRVQHFCQTRVGGVELSPRPLGGYHQKRGEACSGNIRKLMPDLTTI